MLSEVIYKSYSISDFKIEDLVNRLSVRSGTTDIILKKFNSSMFFGKIRYIPTMTSCLGEVNLDNSAPVRCSKWAR